MENKKFLFSGKLAAAFVMLPDSRKADAMEYIMSYGLGQRDSDDEFEELTKIIDHDNKRTVSVSPEEVSYIVGYLNHICGTKYRTSSVNTKKLINARVNEGFKREDFEKVIKAKHREWQGTRFEKYLCPETLFGPKFEKYLNGKSEDESRESSFDTDEFFTAAASRAYGNAT